MMAAAAARAWPLRDPLEQSQGQAGISLPLSLSLSVLAWRGVALRCVALRGVRGCASVRRGEGLQAGVRGVFAGGVVMS